MSSANSSFYSCAWVIKIISKIRRTTTYAHYAPGAIRDDRLLPVHLFTGCGCTWHRRPILMHSSCLSFLAADRTSRLWVFKEVHLPCTSFLESILETVYGLSVNILLWQFIPSIDDPLGKEVQTWIAVTMLLHQFPSVPSGNYICEHYHTKKD